MCFVASFTLLNLYIGRKVSFSTFFIFSNISLTTNEQISKNMYAKRLIIPVHNVRVFIFAHNCDIQTYLLAKKNKETVVKMKEKKKKV
jgi:hypothetical protein